MTTHVNSGSFATNTRHPVLVHYTERLEWAIITPGGRVLGDVYAAHHDDKEIRTLGNAAMILNMKLEPRYEVPQRMD